MFSRAIKISGVSKIPPESYTFTPHDSIIFTATHKGFYYVTLIGPGEYSSDFFYSIIFKEVTGEIDSPTFSYTNTSKKWIFFAPVPLILTLSLSAAIWRNKNRHLLSEYKKSSAKNSVKKKEKCPICGVLVELDDGYCKTCGQVFKVPSNQIT